MTTFLSKFFKKEQPNNKGSDVDWDKMNQFIKNNQYTNLFLYMEAIEKENPDIAKQERKWKEIKDTSIRASLIEQIYNPCSKLLSEKKYTEAIKLSKDGFDMMTQNLPFFTKGDASFKRFSEMTKELEDKDGQISNQVLLDNRKKIRKELEAFNNDPHGGMAIMYFDFMVTPLLCALALDAEAQEYFKSGNSYGKQEKFSQAISDFTKAIEINPNFAVAYSNRGVMYAAIKEYDKAWTDVHKAEELGHAVGLAFLDDLKKASGRDR